MTELFTDEMTPEEAGRADARAAMVEARKILRSALCDHDPVLDGPSGCHVCSKCGRGVNAVRPS